jgi:hypothetical protein
MLNAEVNFEVLLTSDFVLQFSIQHSALCFLSRPFFQRLQDWPQS